MAPSATTLRALAGAALAALLLLGAAAPAVAVTEDDARRAVSEQLPVEVLKVRPGSVDGRAVWLVTVMHTAGNANSSFAVTTLAVDRESGQLLQGYEDPQRGGLRSAAPLAASDERVTGTPPGPDSREPGDSGGATQ